MELNALENISPENLVTSLHVAEVEIGEHVRKQRQKTVADGMPEVQDSVRSARQETRANDYVGGAFDERLQEPFQVLRVVFEVSVLNGDKVTCGLLEAGTERCSLALVRHMPQDSNLRALQLERLGQFQRSVCRCVVDDEYFDLETLVCY
jgi:hypothetical protein